MRQDPDFMKQSLVYVIVLGALAVGTAPLRGQAVAQVSGGPGWVIRSAAHVDLWYHGLAVVGFDGFAPLPLYAPGYAAHIKSVKEAQGLYPTTLDRLRSYFRIAFATDSSFEIFHYLPLYFGTPDPDPMLIALGAAARGEAPEELGARVMFEVLKKKSQREIAGQFIAALEEEWRVFLRAERQAESAKRDAYLAAVEQQWTEQLEPALSGFLNDRRFDRGMVLASPAVGPEGRILLNEPDALGDNTVVVGMPLALDDPTLVLVGAVREFCYPVASREVSRLGVHGGDRVTSERLSSRAAVRCGAMLLDVRAPDLAPKYRDAYVRAAKLDPDHVPFEDAFPVDSQLLKDVRRELRLPNSRE
jgi:hypothetical protein